MGVLAHARIVEPHLLGDGGVKHHTLKLRICVFFSPLRFLQSIEKIQLHLLQLHCFLLTLLDLKSLHLHCLEAFLTTGKTLLLKEFFLFLLAFFKLFTD